jgi:hypothetical protein
VLDEKWPLGYVQVYGDAVVDRDAELAAGVLNQVLGLMAGGKVRRALHLVPHPQLRVIPPTQRHGEPKETSS